MTMISLSSEEGHVKKWKLYDEKQKIQNFDNLGGMTSPKMSPKSKYSYANPFWTN